MIQVGGNLAMLVLGGGDPQAYETLEPLADTPDTFRVVREDGTGPGDPVSFQRGAVRISRAAPVGPSHAVAAQRTLIIGDRGWGGVWLVFAGRQCGLHEQVQPDQLETQCCTTEARRRATGGSWDGRWRRLR